MTCDLQPDETAEALEDIGVQTADAVVGQVSEKHTEKKKKVSWFISSPFQKSHMRAINF